MFAHRQYSREKVETWNANQPIKVPSMHVFWGEFQSQDDRIVDREWDKPPPSSKTLPCRPYGLEPGVPCRRPEIQLNTKYQPPIQYMVHCACTNTTNGRRQPRAASLSVDRPRTVPATLCKKPRPRDTVIIVCANVLRPKQW